MLKYQQCRKGAAPDPLSTTQGVYQGETSSGLRVVEDDTV